MNSLSNITINHLKSINVTVSIRVFIFSYYHTGIKRYRPLETITKILSGYGSV